MHDEVSGKHAGEAPRWWTTEPWRGLVVIAVLIIAAIFIPYIDVVSEKFIRELSKFKMGGVEIELVQKTVVQRKINLLTDHVDNWLSDQAKQNPYNEGCKKSDALLGVDDAGKLRLHPWSYLTLSVFDYFNGDRLAAIEELDAQHNNFGFEMNLYNLLGQLWSTEGYTPG